ncbi:MAG: PAS domain-containing protein [Alphaproteobacteria bacterium]
MGTEVVAIQGADETGKYMEDVLTGSAGAEIVHQCDEILRTRQSHHRRGVVATMGREHVHYERVAFPLASDGEHVDMLIAVFAKVEKPVKHAGEITSE